MKSAENTYRFYPSAENKEEYGHSLIDYAGRLSDEVDGLDPDQALDQIMDLQEKAITAARRAAELVPLYGWQEELLIGLMINQTVALYNRAVSKPREAARSSLLQADQLLKLAEEQLANLPSGLFKIQAQNQVQVYAEEVRSALNARK